MEAFAATLSHKESVAIGRSIVSLRSPEDAKLSGLEKELEDLRKASRKLEERLAKLEGES
jgi:prefoldin subunit 5